MRRPSWRLKLLIFLAPVGFLLFALLYAAQSALFVAGAERATGEVVRVYEHEGDNIVERGETLYEPVFRYEWNGKMTEASVGMPDRRYGFTVGERREILYDPAVKRNVALPGFHHLWALPAFLALLGLVTLPPAILVHRVVARRMARGSSR